MRFGLWMDPFVFAVDQVALASVTRLLAPDPCMHTQGTRDGEGRQKRMHAHTHTHTQTPHTHTHTESERERERDEEDSATRKPVSPSQF
jgi:ABC-type nickel/cobalt efflux system permease component RcnA